MIESPTDFLPNAEKAYRDWLRLEGVKALRKFRSERNITLLKSLLDEPAYSIHNSPAGKREKVYDIRETAYETLRAWHIEIRKPVLREDWPHP